ncbi:MAG: YvcK family protein [Fimbriimonas ginsengisoli]|uniref:Putative gluconeogenesis factor n=1 Tax=Fimbriimonas ginsengisoli TaxID=1005039 RepID=A0A931LXD8_FIMGI|nr:YvcK family protein [Fimbriimonas ginsengisoli]MBI3721812.1 YvcK family protein [Fimbriimonas ginsengisoli]
MSKRARLRRLLGPTAGLKKAIILTLVGLLCFTLGSSLSFKQVIAPFLDAVAAQAGRWIKPLFPGEDLEIPLHMLGGLLLFLGLALTFFGLRAFVRHLVETLNPSMKSGMADVYLRRQRLSQGPKIVALGGGTGLSTLLRGLKQYSSNITAIVTVSDDGGSSGRLVQDKGMIPPGDIRNCLVALADAEKAMTDLFQHRFKRDSGTLSGHSMGNLLLAALADQAQGDFEKAIEIASDVLAIRGRVVPSTLDRVRLRAVLEDGDEICGETAIAHAGRRIRRVFLEPASVAPHQPAIDAIRDADLVCIGPGSVFTSVVPNLLVPGIAQALKDCRSPRVYICNVMTQPGESDTFTASEHVTSVQVNVEMRIFDYVFVNTGEPSQAAIEKYREVGQHMVDADVDRIRAMGFRPVSGNYISESDFVRHDPMRLAKRLMQMVSR